MLCKNKDRLLAHKELNKAYFEPFNASEYRESSSLFHKKSIGRSFQIELLFHIIAMTFKSSWVRLTFRRA